MEKIYKKEASNVSGIILKVDELTRGRYQVKQIWKFYSQKVNYKNGKSYKRKNIKKGSESQSECRRKKTSAKEADSQKETGIKHINRTKQQRN